MNFLISMSIESALPGRSSTIFSGLAGGCTANDSCRFMLLERSTVGSTSGCDHLLRLILNEFGRDGFSDFVFVSVEERSSAGSGEDNLLVLALALFVEGSGKIFADVARATAERPPTLSDFIFSLSDETAPCDICETCETWDICEICETCETCEICEAAREILGVESILLKVCTT